MPHPGARCLSAFTVLALLAVVPAPAAATPASPAGAANLWEMASLAWDSLTRLWSENGCTLDPDGCSQAREEVPASAEMDSLDEGCTLDPSGCAK